MLTSDNFTFKSNYLLKKEDKDYLKKKKLVLSIIERSRKHQKISIRNPELFFHCLLQSYFQSIEDADDDRLQDIGSIALYLYKPICSYLTRIILIHDNHDYIISFYIKIEIIFFKF